MTETTPDLTPTVHVEHCMGTVFTIDLRDPGPWDDAISAIMAWLHRVDAVFSTYRQDSDISRIRRGDLRAQDADPQVAEVLDLCTQLQAETGGYFTAFWDGHLDPTGLVKGWAIEHASELLHASGCHNHAVNGGGDMQLAGEVAPGKPWRVGISDPHDATRLLTIVEGRDFAIATSGAAERGPHIINPLTATPARDLASVTVIGRSLTRADTYATAALAMGSNALQWLEAQPGHQGLIVAADGIATPTSRFYAP